MHPLPVEDTMQIPLTGLGEKVNTQSIKCVVEVLTIVQVQDESPGTLINDIIWSFYIFSRLSIFNTGYQVLFEDVGGSLGNMFLFSTK